MTNDRYYAAMADRIEGRDHEVRSKYGDRMVVSEGATGRAWLKFNPGQTLVWIEVDGKDRWLTRRQADLLDVLQTFGDGSIIRMRDVAHSLHVSPSTVSRGMVKLASMGLVTYVTSRGRHGATIVYRMVGEHFSDVRKRLREAAKAKVRAWAKASHERVSRLFRNVAPYGTWKEIEPHNLSTYYYSMDATLKTTWTLEEIHEAVGA